MPKNAEARTFRYLIARALFGLNAKHPSVHGKVATMYEIMRISCQSWSSVEVMYVHPPHVRVRNTPIKATNLGRVEFGRAVRRYQRNTKANLGPYALLE